MDRLTFEVHDGGMFVRESDVKAFDIEDEAMHTGAWKGGVICGNAEIVVATLNSRR